MTLACSCQRNRDQTFLFGLHLVWLLFISRPVCAAAEADRPVGLDPTLRAAVVRVEAAIDPASIGPDFAAELAARQPWTPYEAEIARRLHIGSTGTGFFVNSRGDLVTNAHVLLSGVRYRGLHFTYAQWDSMVLLLNVIRDVWVTVGEGEEERSYLATPVVIAEDLDLAVLRVALPPGDETQFASLPIASSSALQVGAPVLALGFPEDEFQTASGEILSLIHGARVHEEMQIIRRLDPDAGEEAVTVSGTTAGPVVRLQHSAPTGHGSSGGPLLDDRGRVIAVAYALLAHRGPAPEEDSPASDLNLAIVSDVLKRFLAVNAIPFTEAGQ